MSGVQISKPFPGILHAVIQREEDTTPEMLEPLVLEVERASRKGNVVIVAEFIKIKTVDVRAIEQWASVAARPGVRLLGACAVTEAVLVRLAAQTIGLGSRVKGGGLQISGFADLADGLTWARQLLSSTKASPR